MTEKNGFSEQGNPNLEQEIISLQRRFLAILEPEQRKEYTVGTLIRQSNEINDVKQEMSKTIDAILKQRRVGKSWLVNIRKKKRDDGYYKDTIDKTLEAIQSAAPDPGESGGDKLAQMQGQLTKLKQQNSTLEEMLNAFKSQGKEHKLAGASKKKVSEAIIKNLRQSEPGSPSAP